MSRVCHSFYFSAPRRTDWASWCWEFGERYAESFRQTIDSYDFTTYDHYSAAQNPDELDQELREELNAERVMALVMCSDREEDSTGGEVFAFSVADLRHTHGYGLVYLQVDRAAYPDDQAAQETLRAMIEDLRNAFQLDYGFVDELDAGFAPRLYFSGVGTPPASEAAERDFLAWEMQAPYFRNLYRTVTWGTWLTPGHWGAEGSADQVLATLQDAGAKGFIDEETQGVFFAPPCKLCSANAAELQPYRSEVAAALSNLGIHDMYEYEPSEASLFAFAPHPEISRELVEEPELPAAESPIVPQEQSDSTRVLSLESFFHGAQDESAIGRNLLQHPGLEAFAACLQELRADPAVAHVVVQVSDEDPEDERDLAEWVYVVSQLSAEEVEERLADLEPDVVHEGYPEEMPQGFPPVPGGHTVHAVWWD